MLLLLVIQLTALRILASFHSSLQGMRMASGSNLFTLSLEGFSKSDGSKSNRVSANSAIELKAKLEKDGSAVNGARVIFTLADEVGVLNPSSGSALTKGDGIATLDLTAGTVKRGWCCYCKLYS